MPAHFCFSGTRGRSIHSSTNQFHSIHSMYSKQLHVVKNLNQVRQLLQVKNTGTRSSDLVDANLVEEKATAADLKLQLYQMEELNIAQQKLIEEQTAKLAEVVASNAKFISIIAHDLRSPFGSIIGVLELLKDSYGEYNHAEVEKYIYLASNSAYGTLNLLDNLLAWNSKQNKATYFKPVRINLLDLVMNEFESVSSSARSKQLCLTDSIPSSLHLTADLQMTKTILRNLINNAIKFSYIGGQIKVSATESDNNVEITVQDNGIGMSEKALRELFRKNTMHSTRGTENENGTGLGLLLCKEFVDKHGGNISLESETGKGTKTKFTLPRYI
jgi:signal transduction histidine kinase